MSFRIDSIKVNRGGPLESDFEFSPGDLNLIYGPNESGKTYVMESLIKFLFKDTSAWELREWSGGGVIMVSGLKDDPVAFRTTSPKLEEYWSDGGGLPPELSRLLVVRAGETRLSDKDRGDGVGRSILKDYLSGGGLLDKIDHNNNISLTIKRAKVVAAMIEGHDQGELKTRTKAENNVAELGALWDKVGSEYLSSEAYSLEKKKEALDLQLESLKKAKRYQAWKLSEGKKKLVEQINVMQSGEELYELSSKIKDYQETKVGLATVAQKMEKLKDASSNFRWAQSALGTYKEITSSSVGGAGKKGPWVGLAISLAMMISSSMILISGSTISSGILGLLVLVGTVLAGTFAFFAYKNSGKILDQAGESAELERIRSEFQNRFGSELTNQAALEVEVDKSEESHRRAEQLSQKAEDLSNKKDSLERSIAGKLKLWTGAQAPIEEFEDILERLKTKRAELEKKVNSSREAVAQVGVSPLEYLAEDPGEIWNPGDFQKIKDERSDTDEKLRRLNAELYALKSRVEQETGSTGGATWEEDEDLIEALRVKHKESQKTYRKLTAEILAKIQVHSVIETFREEENERIDAGLREESLADLLYSVTDGKYRNIRQIEIEGEQQLAVIPDNDEEYHLQNLSTGTREQIHMALRMGFASRVMGGQEGFLILDDAFQHSDSVRRKKLIEETVNFVRNGWQVFYFTMDDHIRGLFREVGKKMPSKFEEVDLSASSGSSQG